MADDDRVLADAFDAQAARFERAPVQSDPALLARIVAFASFAPGGAILDAGCGPGLVAEAFLDAGHRVEGVDLSGEMIRRARERCARFGDRARFTQGALASLAEDARFDGSISRFVVHHAPDPHRLLREQALHVRPGGVVVAVDHTSDPEPSAARWHNDVERARDRSHARSLSPGEIVDALASAGLEELRLEELAFELDFDEWFDRGTPTQPKAVVRAQLLAGRARGFGPRPGASGSVAIRCRLALARGVRPR